MKSLVAAQARCGGWESVETAGTADEQNNPIKISIRHGWRSRNSMSQGLREAEAEFAVWQRQELVDAG